MRINAVCFTAAGAELVRRLCRCHDDEFSGYCKMQGIQPEGLMPLEGTASEFAEECFAGGTPLVVVGATGIAVRMIAGCLKNKLEDIPVVVIDEQGKYVIPLLSGHAGGANALALKLAAQLGAVPVITTATDINGCFAADVFAAENRLTINNKDSIKTVNAKALRGEPIVISVKDYPPKAAADIVISDVQPVTSALWLSPKKYVLGIGCRRGKSIEAVETAVEAAINSIGIDYKDIYAFGSVDLKADEKGLLDFSAKHRIPFAVFESSLLMKLEGVFTASDFVREKTGTDNVCERAAMMLAGSKGRLVLKKQANDGVTVAIAARYEV